MSTNPSPQAVGADFEKWVAAALVSMKTDARPRVGFDQLAQSAGVSVRTAKRHFNPEGRDGNNPHIPTGPLYGYARALGVTLDEVVTEALRKRDLAASKDAQEAEAEAAMTEQQRKELREAQEKVKGDRARPRKQA